VAIGLAERGAAESEAEEKRIVAAVMQYLDGRTIDDFRAANLRVVSARNIELDPEERATFANPIPAHTHRLQGRVELPRRFRVRRRNSWPGRQCSFAITAAGKWTRARAQFCG
jgi:hypothetical protein